MTLSSQVILPSSTSIANAAAVNALELEAIPNNVFALTGACDSK